MKIDRSLLAHLSHRFTNRTEDIAVEALGFILTTSKDAREALPGICKAGGADAGQFRRIATQVSGDGGERPDLVGWDENDKERLLIEAKFWAGQPNAYLERLPAGGTLLFVAPEARVDTLWPSPSSATSRIDSPTWRRTESATRP